MDIHETDNHLVVKMELAGARSEDLQVSLSPDDRVLTISGIRTESHADREGRLRCHQLEIYFGPFERAIGLPSIPVNRDQITATYRDGFLQIITAQATGAGKPRNTGHSHHRRQPEHDKHNTESED